MPRLQLSDGVNDAIGGTLSAIGVFHGVTESLITAGVWHNYANASALATQEAATMGSLAKVLAVDERTGRESLRLARTCRPRRDQARPSGTRQTWATGGVRKKASTNNRAAPRMIVSGA